MEEYREETLEEMLKRYGMPLKIEDSPKYKSSSYHYLVARVAKCSGIIDLLLDKGSAGLKIDTTTLKYSPNSMKQYLSTTLTLFRRHSERKECQELASNYHVRSSGMDVYIQKKSKPTSQSPLVKTVEPIPVTSTEDVDQSYSTKNQVQTWLEDLTAEDHLTIENVHGMTDADRAYLEECKEDGMIASYLFLKSAKTLHVRR